MGEIAASMELENAGNRAIASEGLRGCATKLDLVADCTNRTLGPRPESPDSPLLKLK